jgi:hypothetical protein
MLVRETLDNDLARWVLGRWLLLLQLLHGSWKVVREIRQDLI